MKPTQGLLVAFLLALALIGWFFTAGRRPELPAISEPAAKVTIQSEQRPPATVHHEPPAPTPEEAKPAAPTIIPAAPPVLPGTRIRYAAVAKDGRIVIQATGTLAPGDIPDEPLLPDFSGPESWRNLGIATPSAAFETHCWAIYRGEIDVLLSTINPSPASRAKLKAIFDQLPAGDRASYGSPERMLAMIWVYHGFDFPGFKIQSENMRSGNEASVAVQLQYKQKGDSREFLFTQGADGWRKVTPDSQVDRFLTMTGISADPRK